MSPNIMKEIEFLLLSVALGVFVTFVYDWLRIFRGIVRHKNIIVSIEDFLFWCFCFVVAFGMLYQENNGVIRWFAVIGAALGMFLYKLLFSRFFVAVMIKVLTFLAKYIKKASLIFLKPLGWGMKKVEKTGRFAGKKSRKFLRLLKKKLTQGIKEVKMMLCKQ